MSTLVNGNQRVPSCGTEHIDGSTTCIEGRQGASRDQDAGWMLLVWGVRPSPSCHPHERGPVLIVRLACLPSPHPPHSTTVAPGPAPRSRHLCIRQSLPPIIAASRAHPTGTRPRGTPVRRISPLGRQAPGRPFPAPWRCHAPRLSIRHSRRVPRSRPAAFRPRRQAPGLALRTSGPSIPVSGAAARRLPMQCSPATSCACALMSVLPVQASARTPGSRRRRGAARARRTPGSGTDGCRRR